MHWTVLMAWVKKYVAAAISAIDLSAYMKKSVDYVTAGEYAGVGLGEKATAEGFDVRATGRYAHAEGFASWARGNYSHAEGHATQASGQSSHATGEFTIANGANSLAFGKYNIRRNNDDFVETVGNGSSDQNRSDARTLDWSGNEWLAGNLTAAGGSITIGSTTLTESQLQNLLALLS